MRFLGLNIDGNRISFGRTKASASLSPVAENRGGWWPIVRESFSGAWQRNIVVDQHLVLAFHAVYACISLIAGDIAKLRTKLVKLDANGIWSEFADQAYTPVLAKPNHFQTRIQFCECWILSKLMRGNTYALKRRDSKGKIIALYVLDPNRVWPMVAEDGSVFYQLHIDYLSGLTEQLLVPAREIIHDRMNCLFHPLVGTSPIFANGLAAMQGLRIQNNSAKFFGNNSNPGGLLTAPGRITDETAKRLKEHWEENFSGENVGRVAILGDGLKFEKMAITAVDAQLVQQVQWTATVVCGTFHVPPYKIAIGEPPLRATVEALNLEYYSQCLQALIEAMEECLNEGLGIGWPQGLRVQADIDNLLRMDSVTQITVLKDGVSAGLIAPDEGRARLNLPPVPGGASPYLQQQNFSLAALAKRDAQPDPFGSDPVAVPTLEQLALPAPLLALPAPVEKSGEEVGDWAALVSAVAKAKLAERLAA